MSTQCVDVAFYWTPEEAGAIVDYLDRLRDTVWELYSDDIIGCRTNELDEQGDPRQRHLCFDEDDTQASTPCNGCEFVNNNKTPREALPLLDDLPTLSDENIGDMLNLLRTLLNACEEHYKDPIRRLSKQRQQELLQPHTNDLPTSSITDWNGDF